MPDQMGELMETHETYEFSAPIINNLCVKEVHAYLDAIFRNE